VVGTARGQTGPRVIVKTGKKKKKLWNRGAIEVGKTRVFFLVSFLGGGKNTEMVGATGKTGGAELQAV